LYGGALARFAVQHGYGRAAMLYVNDGYGRGVRQAYAREYSRWGGRLLDLDPFLAKSPDVGVYLTKIVREHAVDILVLMANQDEGLRVLRQIRSAGLKLPVLASDGMVGAERVAPALMEGVFVASAYIQSDPREENRRFVAAYRRAYPAAGLPDQGAAASYDAVRLLAFAAKGAESRSQLRNRLAAVGTTLPPFDGAVGSVGFDSQGDVPTLAVRIGVVNGGELVPTDRQVSQP
jgi:ABC-type branched-subunit amino acid transport system substrate-binding protein